MPFARLAFVARGLSAVVTEGGFSDPGSERLTISASWLALVIPRLANVNVDDCDAPVFASPNVEPSKRTPPLSIEELLGDWRVRRVVTAPIPCPCKVV